jgi:Uma2 family endonuclease
VAVVRGSIRDHAKRHPHGNEIALVVEVADASLARDRRKAQIYARAGIPFYWIVNLRDRRLETFSDPATEETPPRYRQNVIYSPAEAAPFVIDGEPSGAIAVADLLP